LLCFGTTDLSKYERFYAFVVHEIDAQTAISIFFKQLDGVIFLSRKRKKNTKNPFLFFLLKKKKEKLEKVWKTVES
jgi:hypothetical protein